MSQPSLRRHGHWAPTVGGSLTSVSSILTVPLEASLCTSGKQGGMKLHACYTPRSRADLERIWWASPQTPRGSWYPFWAMILFLVTLRIPHVSLCPGGCPPPWCFPCLKTFVSISPTVFLGRLVPLNVNTFLIKQKRGVCVKLG